MATQAMEPARRTPWHFWLVAGVSALWNGFGGFDYTMSHVRGDAYYREMGMTAAQLVVMHNYPAWMHAVWAIGVWGSVLGSILLLLRSRWAAHAFALSFLGAAGNLAYTAMTPGAGEAMGLAMPVVILAICAALIGYAWTMTKRGVLR